jgi:hypothetical protein
MKKDSTILILLALMLLGGGYAAYTMTRGLRNNNPGNIVDDGTDWEGLDTPRNDGRFLRFMKPEYGIRALARVLTNYVGRDGVPPTVEAIITRFAPPTENNTAAYIAKVSSDLSVDSASTLDLPSVLPALVASIVSQENGLNPYSTDLIAAGVALA